MQLHRSTIAIALAAVALAAPAAQARPIDPPINTFTEEELRALAGDTSREPGSAPRVQSTDPGFDWASAAVGAGAGAGALALITLGGLSTVGRRRLRAARG